MKLRKRTVLVPNDCIEVFELRAAYYLEPDGSTAVRYEFTNPEGPAPAPIIEAIGVLHWVEHMMVENHDKDA